jgi:hypothetical protein
MSTLTWYMLVDRKGLRSLLLVILDLISLNCSKNKTRDWFWPHYTHSFLSPMCTVTGVVFFPRWNGRDYSDHMFVTWGNVVNDVGSTNQDILSYVAYTALRFSSVDWRRRYWMDESKRLCTNCLSKQLLKVDSGYLILKGNEHICCL